MVSPLTPFRVDESLFNATYQNIKHKSYKSYKTLKTLFKNVCQSNSFHNNQHNVDLMTS